MELKQYTIQVNILLPHFFLFKLHYSTGLIVINLDKIKATIIVQETNIATKI